MFINKNICVLLLLFSLSFLFGFKPQTHIEAANDAVSQISSSTVVLGKSLREYPVIDEVADAIRLFPDAYRAGVVGPDGYPDILIGQSRIHPDSKCNAGSLSDDACVEGVDKSFTHEWFEYIYESGWQYYRDNINSSSTVKQNNAKKALAFVYGYITHGAGDIWAHTMVNEKALGIFPSFTEFYIEERRNIARRHLAIEGYIANHTAGNPSTRSLDAPLDFVTEYLVQSDDETPFKNSHFDYFLTLKKDTQADLDSRDNTCNIDEFSDVVTLCIDPGIQAIIVSYEESWIDDINEGFDLWSSMSNNVAKELFQNVNADEGSYHADLFGKTCILSMMGVPDVLVDFGAENIYCVDEKMAKLNDNVIIPVSDAISAIFAPLTAVLDPIKEAFRDYLLVKYTGMTWEEIKDPSQFIDDPDIGFSSNTKNYFNSLMGVTGNSDLFNKNTFMPYKNTVQISRLLLLNGETLDSYLHDQHVGAIYTNDELYEKAQTTGWGVSEALIEQMQKDAMLGFVRDLDANHQWALKSPPEELSTGEDNFPEGGRKHGEGMPIWIDCRARDYAFNDLFDSWGEFGFETLDSSIPCKNISKPLPPVELIMDLKSPVTKCEGVQGEARIINHLETKQNYAFYYRVSINQPGLPDNRKVIYHSVERGELAPLGENKHRIVGLTCKEGLVKVEGYVFEEMYRLSAENSVNTYIQAPPSFSTPYEWKLQEYPVVGDINITDESCVAMACTDPGSGMPSVGTGSTNVGSGGVSIPSLGNIPGCRRYEWCQNVDAIGLGAILNADNDDYSDRSDNCPVTPNNNQSEEACALPTPASAFCVDRIYRDDLFPGAQVDPRDVCEKYPNICSGMPSLDGPKAGVMTGGGCVWGRSCPQPGFFGQIKRFFSGRSIDKAGMRKSMIPIDSILKDAGIEKANIEMKKYYVSNNEDRRQYVRATQMHISSAYKMCIQKVKPFFELVKTKKGSVQILDTKLDYKKRAMYFSVANNSNKYMKLSVPSGLLKTKTGDKLDVFLDGKKVSTVIVPENDMIDLDVKLLGNSKNIEIRARK